MVERVVSTKISEEMHTKLLDACNCKGCSPSSFIKEAIMSKIDTQQPIPKEKDRDLDDGEIRKFLGIRKKVIGIKKS